MKIIGRIEKTGNFSSIVVETRMVSGRIEILDGALDEFIDGQTVYLELSTDTDAHFAKAFAPGSPAASSLDDRVEQLEKQFKEFRGFDESRIAQLEYVNAQFRMPDSVKKPLPGMG